MRIVIDARMLGAQMHGIAKYTYYLLHYLPSQNLDFEYIALVGNQPGNIPPADNLQLKLLPCKWISIKEQWILPTLLKKLKADLFFSPSFVAPLLCPCPLIMTIHDVNHLALKHNYTIIHQIYYRYIVKPGANKAITVFTDSLFSKSEINKHMNIADGKIKVVYIGIDEIYKKQTNLEKIKEIRSRHSLPEKYILYIGGYKPYKNVERLIKAYSKVKTDTPLLLSGKGNEQIIEIISQLNLQDKISFTGFIEEEDLPTVYSEALLLTFPSKYEGFGLPPLEAMACGCPTLVSTAASLPEVCGKASYYVDPDSETAITQGIEKLLNDNTLRQELIEKGYERVKQFLWQNTAQAVYQEFKRYYEKKTP